MAGVVTAFSLVEVVFAIAIFSFCIITLIFLLDMGLLSERQSQDDSALAGALENLNSSLRALPVSLLTNASTFPSNYYFDAQGNMLPGSANSLYRVIVRRVSSTPSGAFSLALSDTTNYVLFAVEFSYPTPAYASTNRMVIGRALYGSGFGNFYE
ncbi:MAG: hypothetical protein WDO13_07975 [Verrucomicrobiota bacterium]